MRLITLGTGAGKPSLRRCSSATALEFDGEIFLFDCGEATQLQLMRSSLKWSKIRAICITHLHGDHVNGLVGLLSSLSFSERQEPLHLFGPHGLQKMIRVFQECRTLWIDFPLHVQEVQDSGILLDTPRYQILARPLKHVIETWGYRFQEKDRPGVFDAQKADALGVPFGPLRAQLVKGESITLADNTIVTPQEIIGAPRPGFSMAYCLDTRPCQHAVELARGVDCLVHEATYDQTYASEARIWGHSTAAEAAEIAQSAQCSSLLLTHISQRYMESRDLYREASYQFPKVKMAEDLKVFELSEF